jgi:hypothetical protein
VASALRSFNQDFARKTVAQQSLNDYPHTICGACRQHKDSSSGIDLFRAWIRNFRLISIPITMHDQKWHAPPEGFGDSPCQLDLSFKPCYSFNNLILQTRTFSKRNPTNDSRQYSSFGHFAQVVTLSKVRPLGADQSFGGLIAGAFSNHSTDQLHRHNHVNRNLAMVTNCVGRRLLASEGRSEPALVCWATRII